MMSCRATTSASADDEYSPGGEPTPAAAVVYFVTLFCFTACTEDEPVEPRPELTTEAVCDDGAPAFDVTVERHVTEIGPTANDIATGADDLWIVESGTNSLSRFDPADDTLEPHFVDVGTERNPYAAAVDEDTGEIWVTNFASDSVTIADLDTGQVVEELEDHAFADPSSVVLSDDYAYVGNVDYISPSEGYGPGSIAVVDRHQRQVVAELDTAFKNPHFLTIEPIDGTPTLLASLAGTLELSDGVRVTSEGGLQWFDITTNPVDPPSETFPLGQNGVETIGAPGLALLTPEGDRLYFASGIAPAIFAFDVDERQWIYDAQSPLALYESDGDTTHRAAMGPDGLLWVTAFNDDKLHLLDTACDEVVAPPIDLGEVGDMLEGAQAIAIADGGDEITGYYLLSIANAMGRVRLETH